MMAEELYDMKIPQIVIMIANPDDSHPQIFIDNPINWQEKLLTMKEEYDSVRVLNERLF